MASAPSAMHPTVSTEPKDSSGMPVRPWPMLHSSARFAPNPIPRRPYQLDHVFVDNATNCRLTGWNVDAAPTEGPVPLSGHAPIVVTLD